MSTKSIILTSYGLRNINENRYTEDDFINLIFGKKEFKMNRIFAEFISPFISRLLLSDPTINSIKFDDLFPSKADEFANFAIDILSDDLIALLMQISKGFSTEINDTQALKLRFLSIILGNEELFSKIYEVFPPHFSTENLDTYVEYLQSCYYFSHFQIDFDFSSLINFISSNFYSINPHHFLKLPHSIQYSIISNPHLQIQTEDSFLDIILSIIDSETFSEENDQGEKIDNTSFLEQVEFTGLSEDKLREFLNNFDFNMTTNSLWRKFYQCFFIHFNADSEKRGRIHSKEESFEYVENKMNRFEGIINHLTKKFGGNVSEKGVCKITSSSIFDKYLPKNVVDYDNQNQRHVFSSLVEPDSWIKFDFVGRVVHPNAYSIRTTIHKRGDVHLKNWVIEGSNNDKNWKVLDSNYGSSYLKRNSVDLTNMGNFFQSTNQENA